jgi:hypothetical protein
MARPKGIPCSEETKRKISKALTGRGGWRAPWRETKQALDFDFFDNPNTEQQWYWLGFIAGDGHVVYKPGDRYALRIGLKATDSDHLRLLQRTLNATARPVRIRGNIASFNVNSERLIRPLANLGWHIDKTATCNPPSRIPKRHERDFWRGLIDADGCLCRMANGAQYVDLTCNPILVDGFQQFVFQQLGRVGSRSHKRVVDSIRYGGNRQAPEVARLLYVDCEVALARKLAIAKLMYA